MRWLDGITDSMDMSLGLFRGHILLSREMLATEAVDTPMLSDAFAARLARDASAEVRMLSPRICEPTTPGRRVVEPL
ncbi:unnamed protein product [Rangifer tarandus platyrhynchus]|uniref:Uncharacterized protein n=1 Tax=Rangifer tarandus platyrhynchus TaxID=3082113 RepID=A0AC59YRB8_RANTA